MIITILPTFIGAARLGPVLAIGCALTVAACNHVAPDHAPVDASPQSRPTIIDPKYSSLPGERFPIPAVRSGELDPIYIRQQVRYETHHPPGTVIVDPDAKFLYLIQENGLAMRYGVGVGREGFGWTGSAVIGRKAAWPTWTRRRQ